MELKKAERQLEGIVRSYDLLCKSSKGLIVASEDVTMNIFFENGNQIMNNDQIIMKSSLKEDGRGDDHQMSAQETLESLESLLRELESLQPKTEKIRKRMNEKDPITDAPRYGEKTMKRAIQYCQRFDSVHCEFMRISGGKSDDYMDDTGNSSNNNNDDDVVVTEVLRQKVQEEEELEKKRRKEELEMTKWKEKSLQQSLVELQQQQLEQERQAQLDRQREEEQLALRAEMARRQRRDAEARAIQTAMEADRAFVASVTKGPDGVRENLIQLKKACCCDVDSSNEYIQAITALHTIFTQIYSHPEEIKFRRIRRDHPQFMKDIGRHDGGKEVLVAAGFKIELVEGVSCFFTKEPDIEHDMDGWSNWYNSLKQTLDILEEEMIKSM